MTTYLESNAIISSCGRYRYELMRRWAAGRVLVFVMLNPSTADANADDPTIRKCIGFAKRWDYGGIVVVNLFAWRATDPKDLTKVAPELRVGPENDDHIMQTVGLSDVIVAWGANGDAYQERIDEVVPLIMNARVRAGLKPSVWSIKTTNTGQPCHPLRLSYKNVPTRWNWTCSEWRKKGAG